MPSFSHAVWVIFFALGLTVGLNAPAVAQPTDATLRIVVTSAEDGRPLEGANVIVRSARDSTTVRAGATNRDGYLELRRIVPGRYRLTVSFLGFQTHRDTLMLQAGRRIERVALPVATEELDEVTVETEYGPAQRQAGRQRIRAAEIARIPTPGPSGDLASYLQTLPGVVSVGDRGGRLYIRGGAPSQNRFLVDGFPIVQPFHISSFYSAFPQSVIQDVDLYAGGFGAEYAEATSSVIDVRLRPGNTKQFAGRAAIGPHLAALNVEGPIVRGKQSFLLATRYSLIEQTGGPLFGQDTPIGFYDVTGRYSLQRENASCNVTAVRTRDQGSIGPEQAREFTWSNTVLGGRCLFLDERFGHAFSIRGGYTGFQNAAGTVGDPEQQASRWRLFLILNQEQTLLGQPVDFGGRVSVGRYEAKIDEQFVGLEQLSAPQDLVRAHGSIAWAISNHVTVTPSLAGQVTRSTNRLTMDPRVRLSWQPDGTDQQEVSLAAGLYHQTDEGISDERDAGTVFTVWRPPNEDDPIPQSLQAIVGYRQQLGASLEVSVEGYAKRHRNLLVSKWTPEAALETETARANGITYGADARVEARQGPFFAYLGYGWAHVTYEAATDDLGAWIDGALFSYPPPHDRRHQLNTVASYTWWDITTSISWALGTGRPYTQVYGFDLAIDVPDQLPPRQPGTAQTIFQRPYDARLPTYHRLDVSAERSFSLSERTSLDAKLGVINLYDRRNVFYYDVNTFRRVDQSPLLPYFSVQLRVE
jgi:hypothetical protein